MIGPYICDECDLFDKENLVWNIIVPKLQKYFGQEREMKRDNRQ